MIKNVETINFAAIACREEGEKFYTRVGKVMDLTDQLERALYGGSLGRNPEGLLSQKENLPEIIEKAKVDAGYALFKLAQAYKKSTGFFLLDFIPEVNNDSMKALATEFFKEFGI